MNQVVANVTVVLCVAACIAGGIFAWWVENRPGEQSENTGDKSEVSSIDKTHVDKAQEDDLHNETEKVKTDKMKTDKA